MQVNEQIAIDHGLTKMSLKRLTIYLKENLT